MSARPQYRVIDAAPHLRIFDCVALKASLSAAACSDRWAAAQPGSSCHGCPLGRLHYADHHPDEHPPRRRASGSIGLCLRCGRRDLRLIRSAGICVGCYNRFLEWKKGRNSKGDPPATYRPLYLAEVAVQLQDGALERRCLEVLHQAELAGRVARDLPPGARFVPERKLTAWNPATREFERVCTRCGTRGLILERERRGVLERHQWCCGGEPAGSGWRFAPVRQPVMALPVEVAAEWLSGDPELTQEGGETWRATPYVCSACWQGQIEARRQAPGGRWRCRCAACGSESEDEK